MASCDLTLTEIDRYIDDELPAEARSALEAHMADCPECNRAFQERRAAMAMLAEWAGSAPEPAAATARRELPRRARPARWAVLAAAAALLLIGLSAGLYFTGEPEGTGPEGGLNWRTLEGVEVVEGELVVDPFPVNWRTMKEGVEVVRAGADAPQELIVDPFPEEGK